MRQKRMMMNKSLNLLLLIPCFVITIMSASAYAATPEGANTQHSAQVLEQFNEDEELAPERVIETKRKHQILFLMGGTLLILILLAAGFGIAMGVFDKDVFIWHVLSAGLATTLAIAHGVVAFVWFYPS